jgi:hypothetical protein
MLFGIFVGGGRAVVLFAATGNAIYFAIVGIGLALGLSLGVGYDRYLRNQKENEFEQKGEHR